MTVRNEFEELSPYLNQLNGSRVLTRDEELVLARRIQKGDMAARDELVRHNLPFVITIAKKYMGQGARLDDLVQVGNLGLLKATENFDPEKGNRFVTYAVWWIRAYVSRFRKDNRSEVRGGEKDRVSMRDVCLDAPVGEEDGEVSQLERLIGSAPGADERYQANEQNVVVHDALLAVKKRLGDLGWDILQERLTQDEPKTLEELGQRWGVSRERVRQVEIKTKTFLSRYLAELV
jgi:RNA polymerase primary sigma factor